MRKEIPFFLMLSCLLTDTVLLYGNPPEAERGSFQINNWDFNRSGMVKLSGEWEFYWDTLLTPSSFKETAIKPVPAILTVPLSWTSKKNSSYPTRGYGTYRLLIEMPYCEDVFALRLYDIFSASRAWFDGRLIYTAGTPGTDKKGSKPGFVYADVPVFLDTSVQRHELIIQVSNFHHTRAGLVKPVTFSLHSQLAHQTKSMLVLNLIITGIILVIGLTHMISYWLRPGVRSNFYFGMLCLVMILRNISTGDRIITFLFPGIGWEWIFKLDNFSGFGTIPLFAIFLYLLYRKEFPKTVFYLIVGMGTLISLFVFFTPQAVYGRYRMIYELYILAGGLYLTFVVLVKASVHKREGALLTFIGFFVLYGTAINDVLISMDVIHTLEVAPFGLVFYMLTQSFILTRGSAQAMAENEELSRALQEEKQGLENRVEERTKELQQQNSENVRQKEALEEQGWFNSSLTRINNVMNHEREDIETLCRKLLGEILSLLDACIGAIYLAAEKDGAVTLELAGSMNACQEMLTKPSLFPGEGLIGACYKDRQISLVTDVSESFVRLTSGLGGTSPRNILLVPLKVHNTIIGVMEIASIKPIQQKHLQLMEKASENIASNLRLIQINARNAFLINSSREKEREFLLQRQELHQQLEELQALREQVQEYRSKAIH